MLDVTEVDAARRQGEAPDLEHHARRVHERVLMRTILLDPIRALGDPVIARGAAQ
ncbi:MAG: hypothetical protein AB7L28_02005 [Kofleriaceae bacterium]